VAKSPVVVPTAGLGSFIDLVEMELEGGRGLDRVLLRSKVFFSFLQGLAAISSSRASCISVVLPTII
jgi:hypothetical protein